MQLILFLVVLVELLFLVTVLLAAVAYQIYDPVHGVAAVDVLRAKYFAASSGFVILYILLYFNFFQDRRG
jgi:hypothetical protein